MRDRGLLARLQCQRHVSERDTRHRYNAAQMDGHVATPVLMRQGTDDPRCMWSSSCCIPADSCSACACAAAASSILLSSCDLSPCSMTNSDVSGQIEALEKTHKKTTGHRLLGTTANMEEPETLLYLQMKRTLMCPKTRQGTFVMDDSKISRPH